MHALHPRRARGTDVDGSFYRQVRGRYAPRTAVVDLRAPTHAVVELRAERPSADDFLRRIDRELKIRFYQPKTRKSYRSVLSSFFRWFGRLPHAAINSRQWLTAATGSRWSACDRRHRTTTAR